MAPSVVVASRQDLETLARCLGALAPQCAESGAELLVVRRRGEAALGADLATRYGARIVEAPADATVPTLRGIGLLAATGDPVLLTEDHLVPAPDWLRAVDQGFQTGADVVGGGLWNAGGRLVDWAAYFAEYGIFSGAGGNGAGQRIVTGANVAYRRHLVADVGRWAAEGAWENVIHDRLAAAGRVIRFEPGARVYHDHRYRFGPFVGDRFRHGLDYARSRIDETGESPWKRLAFTPGVAPVLFARVAQASAREAGLKFATAAPLTFAFLCAWAAGEASGYWSRAVGRLRRTAVAALAALAALSAGGRADAQVRDLSDPFRFVVVGHIRGSAEGTLSPRLAEVLAEVRALAPDLVFVTGDIIWGDVHNDPADSATVERQWDAVDSALATLGRPVYRVPGNHDISDIPSRDIYVRRYGRPPQAVTHGTSRFLLLSSAWIPADGDTRHNPFVRTRELDSLHLAFLRTELQKDGPWEHTFVLMHHLLWWEPDTSQWWQGVHPLLAAAGVDAVFSGDYGPLKFSTMERDGVRYFQSSIEVPVALQILRDRMSSRLLSAQFDNYLEVIVAGEEPEIRVHTLGEVSSGEFTPERYRAVNAPAPAPALTSRIWDLIGSPKRIAALTLGAGLLLGAGYFLGRRAP